MNEAVTLQQIKSRWRKEQYTDVIDLATGVIQTKPDFADAWYLRAQAKYKLGNMLGAIQDLTSLLSIDPNHVQGRLKRYEYTSYLIQDDVEILAGELPAYREQFYTQGYYRFPVEMDVTRRELAHIFHRLAIRSEKDDQITEAIKYWRAYLSCDWDIDGDSDLIKYRIERMTWLEAARAGHL